MSRRKTVVIDYVSLKKLIDANFHKNNTLFCIAMGFEGRTSWVSDLKRGRNLPSPEEAAKMCELLRTTPREILLKEEDIELVEGLLAERDPGIKNPPAQPGGEMDAARKRALYLINNAGDDKIEDLLKLLELMQKMDGKMLNRLVALIETTVG